MICYREIKVFLIYYDGGLSDIVKIFIEFCGWGVGGWYVFELYEVGFEVCYVGFYFFELCV